MSSQTTTYSSSTVIRDLISGVVVFLVALPLCLGIALASGADLFSGLLAGIVGGLVVAAISGSHTSVSGPAAGLTAIVAAQIAALGSFEAFLLAVLIGGAIQVGFGIAKGGALSAFFPSSVIKGLLVAIGVILILKQIPHVFGHDADPEGDMSFVQPDSENTFTEILLMIAGDIHVGAMVIGIASILFLAIWDRIPRLKSSLVPSPLVVVLLGVALNMLFSRFGGKWLIGESHLVQIPIASSASEFIGFLRMPDFTQLLNPAVYIGAITIAVVASLETLLNLEAVDKLDTEKRNSPASRELIAQGCGNMVCGMIGGLPVTSVIVRSSVNVNSGGKTKLAAIFHGILLLLSVAILPGYMNMIPLSALAAILLVTGFKLASPKLFKQMWNEGRYQFVPFIVTVVAIVFTDLLIGILIGLGVAVLFILNSNLRRPIRRVVETHLAGDITHIELANQVSFLNRAAIERILDEAKPGTRLTIDASASDYIDPDVLSLIRDYKTNTAPARDVLVNLVGFRSKYQLSDDVQFADYTTRELQDKATADQVIKTLREGNRRFVSGTRLNRDLGRQVNATAMGQNPLAAVLSCIDSRVPTELVFDLGVGDIFSVRVAGNIIGTKSLGSLEYAVGVAGVKLVVVLGHTRCGAVTSSVKLVAGKQDAMSATGCEHLQSIVDEIAPSIKDLPPRSLDELSEEALETYVDNVAKQNVIHTAEEITRRSQVIRNAVGEGRVKVIGALYDVKTGEIEFFGASPIEPEGEPARKSFADSPR
ncbi:carbonic anhydrase/SulP family sulfate permease [Rhodopirellula rubra]|uniref:Carbonic anhydrase/SulP family sulfate permease n=1 Tax=Aporhodopirellula rubra TaxID=980271 RepID=A0A7W5DZA4_9BACT|nr:SulP family inorganic anion transporter [Aporhodopirellula rubra]MBB3206402.1 carbonic anhydrase/SulP family sulfate permease [Aporhodopirellula rubra]